MAEEVLINVTLGKSIQDLETLLKESTKEMKNLDLSTQAGKESFKKLSETIGQVKKEQDGLKQAQQSYGQQTEKDIKLQKAFDLALGDAVGSLGDMQSAMRILKKESIGATNPEDVKKYNLAIGKLKNDLQDVTAFSKAMDKGEYFNNMRAGLQGAIAMTQLLGASLKLMGIESEAAKKLEAATLQLVSATQALQVIKDLHDKGTVKALVLQTKEAVVKAYNTVITWGQTAATKAAAAAEENLTVVKGKGAIASKIAAAAQWLWNIAMSMNPIFLIIAAVAALGVGIAILVSTMKTATAEEKRNAQAKKENYEASQESIKGTTSVAAKLKDLIEVVKDTKKSELERKEALDTLNETMGTNITNIEELDAASEKYISHLKDVSAIEFWNKKLDESTEKILDTKKGMEDADPGWFEKRLFVLTNGFNLNAAAQDIATKKMKNYKEAMTEASNSVDNAVTALDALNKKNNEYNAIQKKIEDDKKKADEAKKKAEDAGKKAYQDRLDMEKKLRDEELNAMEAGYEKDLATLKLNNTKKLEAVKGNSEAAKNLRLLYENELLEAIGKLQAEYRKKEEDAIINAAKKRNELEAEQKQKEIEAEYEAMQRRDDARKEETDKIIDAANRRKAAQEQADQEKLESANKSIQTAATMNQALADMTTMLMDAELAKAGENEQKKKEIRKKYALLQASQSVSQIIISTAQAVMQGYATLGPIAGTISGVLLSVLGTVQAAIALKQKGIISAAAGGGTFRTSRPTMLMVGDNPGGVEEVNVKPISGVGQTRVNQSSGMIQMAGGGSVISDGGYGSRFAKGSNNNDIKQAIIEGMMKAPAPNLNYSQYQKFEAKQVRINKNNTL